MSGQLVLVRHGQSEWNARNLFTGWRDVGLTGKGREEARRAGRLLADRSMRFDAAFTSALIRAQETCARILEEIGQPALEMIKTPALNERDYGELTGMNKQAARDKWGDRQVHLWRRSWDVRPPGGESLQDTSVRVLAFYEPEIVPLLRADQSVLICAHGNSLRALIRKLDAIAIDRIPAIEIATGEAHLYRIGAGGAVEEREVLADS